VAMVSIIGVVAAEEHCRVLGLLWVSMAFPKSSRLTLIGSVSAASAADVAAAASPTSILLLLLLLLLRLGPGGLAKVRGGVPGSLQRYKSREKRGLGDWYMRRLLDSSSVFASSSGSTSAKPKPHSRLLLLLTPGCSMLD
jgi:hypothetical protein